VADRTVSRHLTNKGAAAACSFKRMNQRQQGRSSGWSRLNYNVRPWLRIFYRVVER
jgi:hypothetical protein